MKALDSISYGAGALGLFRIINEVFLDEPKVLKVVADAMEKYSECFYEYDVKCSAIYEKMFCNNYYLGVDLIRLNEPSRLYFYGQHIESYQIVRNLTYGLLITGGFLGADLIHRAYSTFFTEKMKPATLLDRVTYGVESLLIGLSAQIFYTSYSECSTLYQLRDVCENQQETFQSSCRKYHSAFNWVKKCFPDSSEDPMNFLCSDMTVNYVAISILSIVSLDLLRRSLSGCNKTRIFSYVATGCAGFGVAQYLNK